MAEARLRGRPKYSGDEKSAAIFRKLAEDNLERSDSTPLWVQLKNRILHAINTGLLPPQSQIPPEQTLCEIFEASKPVIRAAFGALASEGHIIKMPRKGMFVAGSNSRETDFITSNLGVFGDLTNRGHVVTVKTFEFLRAAPNEAEQRLFGIPANGSVIRIGRVYFSDGQPLTLTHISLPGHRVPGMEKLDIENRSVFETIKQHYGLTVKNAPSAGSRPNFRPPMSSQKWALQPTIRSSRSSPSPMTMTGCRSNITRATTIPPSPASMSRSEPDI